MTHRRYLCRGDSLVEVIVSMALISLIAMAVLPLFVGSRVLLRTGTQTSQGTAVAERDVTLVRSIFSSGASTARANCTDAVTSIITDTDTFPLTVSQTSKQYAGDFSLRRVLSLSSGSADADQIDLSDMAIALQDDATKSEAQKEVTSFCTSVTPDPADAARMSARAFTLHYAITVTALASNSSGSDGTTTAASLSTNLLLLNSPS